MKVRAYIILGHHKKTGEIVGFCETNWGYTIRKDRVKICNRYAPQTHYGKLYNDTLKKKGTLKYNALSVQQYYWRSLKNWEIKTIKKKYPQYNFTIYRINSKHCPVKIDWTNVVDMKLRRIPFKKTNWVNLPFVRRENVCR